MAGKRMGPVSWVNGKEALDYLLEMIIGAERVVMDLETTGLDEHSVTGGKTNGGVAARVALATLTLPMRDSDGNWNGEDPTTFIIPLSHEWSPWRGNWKRVLAIICRRMVDYRIPLENQNVKFDAKYIEATTKVDVSDLVVWCTQVASHLLDETTSTALKQRAPQVFGIDRWDEDIDFKTPGAAEHIDLFTLGTYAAGDTYWAWRLGMHAREVMYLNPNMDEPEFSDEIEGARLGKLASWVAMPTVQVLTKIEQAGMKLDIPWVEEHLEADMSSSKNDLMELADRYGMDKKSASTAPTSLWFKELTQRAVEAGDLRVAAMTPGGNPQWSKGVLKRQEREAEKLGNEDSVAGLILRQRGASKRAEYLRSWLQLVTPEGTIHTTYWPGRVITGRLSSESPNMQQVTKSLRPAFIPREGHYMVDLDYSQVELRVAAFISRSPEMIEAFKNKQDLHRILAAKIVNQRLEKEAKFNGQLFEPIGPLDVTKADRQAGKSANFGLLYGMGAYGFKEYAETVYGVQLTEAEAAEIHKVYFDTWSGLREWHQRMISLAHGKGQVVSPLGRVRRVHDKIWDGNPKMVSYAERAAINAPVQGTASDLLMTAASAIMGVTPGTLAIPHQRLVGTVHDSLVGEVEIDHWKEAVDTMQYTMENLDVVLAKMGVEFDVPLVADATVGTRWSYSDIAGED